MKGCIDLEDFLFMTLLVVLWGSIHIIQCDDTFVWFKYVN